MRTEEEFLGVVAYTSNHGFQEAKTLSDSVPGQPGLHNETLYQ